MDERIRDYDNLIHSIYHRYFPHCAHIRDDLFQAGRRGVWRALIEHDPSAGAAEASHVWRIVRYAMVDEIRYRGGMSRSSSVETENYEDFKINDDNDKLDFEHSIVCEDLRPDEETDYHQHCDCAVNVAERLDRPASEYDYWRKEGFVGNGITHLSIMQRILSGDTVTAIARDNGVSATRVSQILTKICNELEHVR